MKKTEKIQLRPITEKDIQTVRKLAGEIWNEYYIKILPQAQINYMLNLFYNTDLIRNEINSGIAWEILFENNNPIGYLVTKLEPEKLYISKIYLKDETRGKGYGRSLLKRAIELAKLNNKKAIYLNVNKFNKNSIDFYEKNNFQKVKEGVFDIGNGFVMDDYIYELPM